jgi:lysophospholipase L1-like esterase
MGAIGDSISAGTLADTAVTVSPLTAEQAALMAPVDSESSLDSSGGQAQGRHILTNRYNLAWGTGDKIPSHYLQLKDWLAKNSPGAKLVPLNIAVPGAMSKDLNAQAEKLVDEMNTRKYKALKYVTLTIGANDACSTESKEGTPNDKFADNLRNVFRTLSFVQQDEPIRVMISSIPRIPDLGRPFIQQSKTLGGLSCATIRKYVFRYCHTLPYWKNADEYQFNVDVVTEKNRVLQEIVDEVNSTYPNIQASYSSAIYDTDLVPEYLAIDCFHPNKVGQTTFAEKLWADQPWFH